MSPLCTLDLDFLPTARGGGAWVGVCIASDELADEDEDEDEDAVTDEARSAGRGDHDCVASISSAAEVDALL